MTQLEKFINDIFMALQEKFPNVAIQYQYIIDTHFVKVTPSEVYNSEEFIDLDFEFNDKFDASDLEGMLCFSTEDALIDLDNPTRTHNPVYIKQTEKVELVEEYQGFTNIYVKNDKGIIRPIQTSSFSKIIFNNKSNHPIDTTRLAA